MPVARHEAVNSEVMQRIADARLVPDAFYIGVGPRAVEPEDLYGVDYVDGAPVPWIQTRDSLIILHTTHNIGFFG